MVSAQVSHVSIDKGPPTLCLLVSINSSYYAFSVRDNHGSAIGLLRVSYVSMMVLGLGDVLQSQELCWLGPAHITDPLILHRKTNIYLHAVF